MIRAAAGTCGAWNAMISANKTRRWSLVVASARRQKQAPVATSLATSKSRASTPSLAAWDKGFATM
jgi:hypothetical protein